MPHAVEKSVPLRRYPANAALGKAVTASAASTAAPLSAATDNVTTATPVVDLGTGVQWIQVDLGGSYDLSRITVSHYWRDGRTYHDVIIRVSTDGVRFTTVFNNDTDGSAGFGIGGDAEYTEGSTGKQVVLPTTTCARYVRFYTNGNSVNAYNHYSELQAFGTGVPSGCPVNVALGTTPTASVASAAASLSTATDNVMTATPVVDLGTGLQWIQLDLGGSYDLTRIGMSHYWGDGRTYHDVIVRASADTTIFTTVFNNDTDGSAGWASAPMPSTPRPRAAKRSFFRLRSARGTCASTPTATVSTRTTTTPSSRPSDRWRRVVAKPTWHPERQSRPASQARGRRCLRRRTG